MLDSFILLPPLGQAMLVGLFTWGMTAVGAAFVYTTKTFNQKLMDGMLGFAGGVMIAASFWSLLQPSVALAKASGTSAWFPAAIGFMLGGLFLWSLDKILPHLHPNMNPGGAEGLHPHKQKRSTLLVLAITLHNIPEGLAIGVALGAAAMEGSSATLAGALVLAIGLGVQNIPEGFAVSMPLRRDGFSRNRSFMYGQLSGLVEPVAAVVGVLAITLIQPILPYALSFAAGAMIFVVAEEVIPASQEEGNGDMASILLIIGFTIMMILDVALS